MGAFQHSEAIPTTAQPLQCVYRSLLAVKHGRCGCWEACYLPWGMETDLQDGWLVSIRVGAVQTFCS